MSQSLPEMIPDPPEMLNGSAAPTDSVASAIKAVEFGFPDVPPEDLETGDNITIPGEVIEPEPERVVRPRGRRPAERGPETPKSTPPSLDEWQRFFSRIVLRAAADYYVAQAFRGVDEDALSDREIERLRLSPQERDEITRPFSELANRSKFMRKHGRSIVASADSVNSLIILGMWASRVRRIANKHKGIQPGRGRRVRQERIQEAENNGSFGQTASQGGAGSYGGTIPENVIVLNPGGG